MYLNYTKSTKIVTWRNWELIKFMINCFNEFMKININASYYICFSFLRDIGVHMKNSMTNKSEEVVRNLCNWQILNNVRLLSSMISKHPSFDELGELVYPLSEIVTALFDFNKTNNFYPLRLHYIDILIDLAERSNVFIPIIRMIKELLNA